jgi:hypothetical protein
MSNYGFHLNNGRMIAVCKKDKKILKKIYLYNPKYTCSSDCKNTPSCKCTDGKCLTLTYHKDSDLKILKNLHTVQGQKFMITPTNIPHTVSNLFITGPPGSGKSDFIVQYLRVVKALSSKSPPVLLISEGERDDRLDPYITKRIPPKSIVEEDLMFNDFQDLSEEHDGLIVIFDDIDALINDKSSGFLKRKTYELMNSIINNSRKYNISVIFTSHNALEGHFTGTAIRSCSNWVFFTAHINTNTMTCGKTYFDVNQDKMKRIKEMAEETNSHWICIANTTPKCLITEHHIYKLDDI